jgi:hypothetical protein
MQLESILDTKEPLDKRLQSAWSDGNLKLIDDRRREGKSKRVKVVKTLIDFRRIICRQLLDIRISIATMLLG